MVHFSGNTYTTRTHDSLKISNGKWMWWSRGIGGRSALDYLIKVKDYSFLEAVELLAGQANIQPPLSVSEQLPVEKHLLLPKENRYHTNVFSYLTGRGIDKAIIRFCIETGRDVYKRQPFGEFKLFDNRYDRYNFFIHDYFFAKTLDKVRPGGVIAFITSSGTMDKKNPYVRRYLAQRAELIGAIRLPNDTFTKNAGTKVTSDIIFLQKRDHMILEEPDWVYLDYDDNGIEQNRYYVRHPEMILGEMVMESGPYGMRSTCRPYEGRELSELLSVAVEALKGTIEEVELEELIEDVYKRQGTHKRLTNVPFKITSKTTGESHIVVTDKNGQFSTASDWASHKKNTNAGKSSEDGIWFGTSEPDDSKGALLYDTYEIEELSRCV